LCGVGLHPAWLMFALFAFGYLFGFVGLLLAVPLAAASGVLIRFALAIVAGIVVFGQFMEGNVLAPKLVGKSVGLHPVWLMFALFVFGYLFGFVGLLLAVPLAAASGVLIRFALARYLASPLYTGNQPP
jgi:predicted PurR-regulated permease PerM